MSLVMAKEALATLLVDFQCNLEWRHKSSQPYVSLCPTSWVFILVLTQSICEDAILSFATIALAIKVPRMTDAKAQQVAVVIWGIVLLGMYSFLLSVFRAKNAGYPFFLPPF